MKTFDIRAECRSWNRGEVTERHDEQPKCLEVLHGKLRPNHEPRLVLLAALLERAGTVEAVKLGPLDAWKARLVLRESSLGEQ